MSAKYLGGAGCGVAILFIAGVIALMLAWTAFIAFILLVAWNAVVPSVFGGPTLDYGAAFALVFVLNIIGRLIFGSWSSASK